MKQNCKLLQETFVLLLCSMALITHVGCVDKNRNLVPTAPSKNPNYWCTWYWQNYLIKKGQKVEKVDPKNIYTNQAARDQLTEETVFGPNGMAVVMLPKTRSDFYFLIDHGWQDKNIKENTFFTSILDKKDFPRYTNLSAKDRIKQMNEDIEQLGWRGLGLWFRGNKTEQEMRQMIEWSKYAGIRYWKIDGGDITHYYATKIKDVIYPELIIEHITGTGPLNSKWDTPNLNY
ncbi:hypothetical protein K5X82_02695 [Halosquirtibacter xylanolyticus]|uniref:hypothetical protein n=1 Tax=Halosquirtibacter xylanolyticus TaxID=3374599 RepID=UPI003747BF18|nr:hypothetical protein K5X82_02695 [Prolixibacteraceae bacterium]